MRPASFSLPRAGLSFFAPLLLLALCVLFLLSLPLASAKSRLSCRRCNCKATLTGNFIGTAKGLDQLWTSVNKDLTGGDEEYWPTLPTAKNGWQGTVHMPRLCGNGAKMWGNFTYNYFSGGETHLILDCDCEKSVKCNSDSDCTHSKIPPQPPKKGPPHP